MRDKLSNAEIDKLKELGFVKKDNGEVKSLSDLLEALPSVLEIFRYKPEERWENMSSPTYFVHLNIYKTMDDNDNDLWCCSYENMVFRNPDLCLSHEGKELIEVLYNLAVSYMTAPKEWVKK